MNSHDEKTTSNNGLVDINPEKLVIGLLLKDNSLAYRIDELEPMMFSNKLLGSMYKTILRYTNNSAKISSYRLVREMVSDELTEKELMAFVNECEKCAEKANDIITATETIIDDWTLRAVRGMIKNKTLDNRRDVKDLIAKMESIISEEKTAFRTIAEIGDDVRKKIFTENRPERIHLGFTELDDIIGGIEKGDVVVVGARSGVGKSAFVSQIISNISADGKRVGLYNLEMHDEQVYKRLLSFHSKVRMNRIKNADSYDSYEEKRVIENSIDVLSKRAIFIKSKGKRTVSSIKNECRNMDFDLLIIDYLGLLSPESKYSNNRTAEVGHISRAIRAMALELNLPVIILSQLNRISESTADKMPEMSHLRESGDIEQDASIVILIWNIQEEISLKGVKVAKNRDGVSRMVYMVFDGATMTFKEIEKDEHDYMMANYEKEHAGERKGDAPWKNKKRKQTDKFVSVTDDDELPFDN